MCDFVELVLSQMLVIEEKENLSKESPMVEAHTATRRITAKELACELEEYTGKDDSYYKEANATKIPDLQRYNQTGYVIRIQKTIETVRTDVRQRHR